MKNKINKRHKFFQGYKKLKHVKLFEQYIKEFDEDDEEYDEEEDGEDGSIDYQELEWKMDKYMSEDVEDQDEYYDILYSGDAKELEDYFERAMVDEDRFNSYLGTEQTLKGFCEHLIENNKKPEKYIDTPSVGNDAKTLAELFEVLKAEVEKTRLKDEVTFSTDPEDAKKEDTIVLTDKEITTDGFGSGFTVTLDGDMFSYVGQGDRSGDAQDVFDAMFRRIKWYNQDW